MWHRNRPRRSSLLSATVLTLFIHIVGCFYLFIPRLPKETRPQVQRVNILSQKDVQTLLNRRPQISLKKKKKPPPPPPSPPSPKPKGQIVDTQPPKKEEIPSESRFLSSFNQKVKKQMVNRNRAEPQMQMLKSKKKVISNGKAIQGKKKQPSPSNSPSSDLSLQEYC